MSHTVALGVVIGVCCNHKCIHETTEPRNETMYLCMFVKTYTFIMNQQMQGSRVNGLTHCWF